QAQFVASVEGTKSTLFPYTTLFRSLPRRRTSPFLMVIPGASKYSKKARAYLRLVPRRSRKAARGKPFWNSASVKSRAATSPAIRSEEHTSELQSRENLVCRLLLEKK